jgi:hypothetical protein
MSAAQSEVAVPSKPKAVRDITALPDYAVLSKDETCAVLNLSRDTLDRRAKSGEIERIRLSPRRVGHTVRAIRAYLARNSSDTVAA